MNKTINCKGHAFQQNLELFDWRLYILTVFFVAGNILFPLMVHKLPLGGQMLLPIFFFTLIGAYKFGWRLGLLTAIFSTMANHFILGLPNGVMLAVVLFKGIILAIVAASIASWKNRLSVQDLMVVIFAYQTLGFIFEGLYISFVSAYHSFILGIPGLLLQLIIGYIVIRLFNDLYPMKE